ncbi:triphosphoribosyl-dephospho-CoA synthase CitG [Enterococcus wangshanyuanii]|uniref:Probable 2-(5''-triphosphoribosyl)-3'-dephosphocoenzyme-A synthase n=1 Tax=Enterococcus wangshanyuanii TaxID=2005703 RepID=A0ABQ1NW45_9ENTE|nr:triphosphoribosyl-dephospho-CoA synthase CitG [Enterococcus wangshanyuanii]GGC86030.1 putative 2-(5''-triphosphoribosyl)-3'-dephosphocoenzyme-A synthase [Enterococcus wangshanyuanii]
MTQTTNLELLKKISNFALQSLLFEAALYPKPGLVDPISSGAHNDMDYGTFLDSSQALAPFFTDYLELGLAHQGTPEALFQKVRSTGQLAEQEMLKKTKGINTHKGANFSFALILASIGNMLQNEQLSLPFSEADTRAVFDYTKQMTSELIARDFSNLTKKKQLTNGEKLYLDHGFTGIRGEAAAGYPSLQETALPFLRQRRSPNERKNFLLLLLSLMATVEDSNLINRGGIGAWQQVQKMAAQQTQSLSEDPSIDELERKLVAFDRALIQDYLSPGGSADLLALSYFFSQLEGLV